MSDRHFDLPEETEEFRRLVREIAEDKLAPRAQEVDETDKWPKDLWEVLVEHGLMGVGYPEKFGGGGGGSLTFAVMTGSCPGCRRAPRSRRSWRGSARSR